MHGFTLGMDELKSICIITGVIFLWNEKKRIKRKNAELKSMYAC